MRELLHDDGFQIALVVGLALSGAIAFVHRRGRLVSWGFDAGAAAAIAALVALFATHRRAMLSLVGLALLSVGAVIRRRISGRRIRGRWTLVAIVPGAALIALALDAPVPDWAAMVCFGAIVVTVPCAVALDRAAPRVFPMLLAASAVGMWATTPDTEHTRVMVGALVGTVVLVFDHRLRAGAAGTAATVALMVWALTLDGYPRTSAVIGALGCFGVVVVLTLVGQPRIATTMTQIIFVLALQAGVVIVCSRVAGFRDSAAAAIAISVAAWAIAGAALRLAARARLH